MSGKGKEGRVPQIRFVGFTDPWEQRKLGEVGTSFDYGLNAAATEYDGKHKYLRITDIDDETHEFLERDLTTPLVDLEASAGYLLKEGDLLFARTGASVGKTYLYRQYDGTVYFAGFLIRARIDKNANPEFVYQTTLTNAYRKYVAVTSQRSGQPGVNAQEYADFQIMLPSKTEQLQIGTTLRSLDSLITLHQRKYDKLCEVKKSMLDKMFPKGGSLYPEIRFAGFTDPWEQRKLGNEFVFLNNNTLSRAELSDSKGLVRNVHYGDVLIKHGAVLDAADPEIPRVANPEIASSLSSERLRDGDVVVADTAEDDAVGKCSELRGVGDRKVVAGLHTMPLRPLADYAPGFLGYYLNSAAYHDQLKPLMQGIKVISVSRTALAETQMLIPGFNEQCQIGRYFANLDSLITLHQRKLELLRNIKRAMLDKMFA